MRLYLKYLGIFRYFLKLHLISKVWRSIACSLLLPCIIWCLFVLYGSTKDTAIEQAYCCNSARQVIVVLLYLKYLGDFKYFLARPDYCDNSMTSMD